jgi:hypothetical protein
MVLNLWWRPSDQLLKANQTDPTESQESHMLRKSSFLAIAAVAALGLATFSASEASARGHGGGGSGMHGGGGGVHSGGMHGGHGGRGDGGRIGHHHPHPHWHVRYHRPIWYGGVRTVGYTVGRPVAGPCTCLSKEYTPDGRVLFKDICTNEAAINPPIVTPQQTGAIEAPVQQASNAVQYQATPANALPQVDTTTGLPK